MSQAPSVLVVDDEPHARQLLKDRLAPLHCETREAANGLLALAQIRQAPPDLVLLDMRMPVMAGDEVLKALKGDGLLDRVPVIIISAVDDIDGIAECLNLGAVDYLAVQRWFLSDSTNLLVR